MCEYGAADVMAALTKVTKKIQNILVELGLPDASALSEHIFSSVLQMYKVYWEYPDIVTDALTKFIAKMCTSFFDLRDIRIPHPTVRILLYAICAGALEYVRARATEAGTTRSAQSQAAQTYPAEVALTSRKASKSRTLKK